MRIRAKRRRRKHRRPFGSFLCGYHVILLGELSEANPKPTQNSIHYFFVSFKRANGFSAPFSAESIRHSQLSAFRSYRNVV
jgi:hypothetical protein